MRSPKLYGRGASSRLKVRKALGPVVAVLVVLLSGCSCCQQVWGCCTNWCSSGYAWLGNCSDRYAANQSNCEGIALYNQGYYYAAQTKFQEALAYAPDDPDIHYNLAATYHRQANVAKAEYYYNQCLDRDLCHRKGYHALAVLLLEQNRQDDAVALMEGWADQMPHLPEPSIELAWVYRQTGDLNGAQAELQHALDLSPRHPEALAALGTVYEAQGRNDRAVAMYGRSLQSNGNQPIVSARLAQLRAAGGLQAGDSRIVRMPQSNTWF